MTWKHIALIGILVAIIAVVCWAVIKITMYNNAIEVFNNFFP